MLKALNYYKGLVDSGAAPKRVATIKTYDDFNAAALAGTTAMFLGGHWQHFQLKEAMTAGAVRQVGSSPSCPGRPPDQRSTGTGGWTVAAFSKDPEKIEACASLMREVYMGPANEVGRRPADAAVAVRRACRSSRTPTTISSSEYLVHGQARPGVPIYPEISNQIQIMMGEVLSGSKAPEAALDDAWDRVDGAYKQGAEQHAGGRRRGAAASRHRIIRSGQHEPGRQSHGARAPRRRRAGARG